MERGVFTSRRDCQFVSTQLGSVRPKTINITFTIAAIGNEVGSTVVYRVVIQCGMTMEL